MLVLPIHPVLRFPQMHADEKEKEIKCKKTPPSANPNQICPAALLPADNMSNKEGMQSAPRPRPRDKTQKG
ncbi:hypothetical protein VTJ04DRAFT_8891 [Mycothermus thermophilus]|uniref:uncharacterized protein n=1 Tax=Humicola insolens TaxID=85995 RepID=UPI003742E301